MALGEAFVNVRADLKPFAKDLEKGLKAIIAAAEKKLAADPAIGRALQDKFNRSVGTGVSDGLEEGFAKGTKKGTQRALTGMQKFLAAVADFADDGLSAIPAKVKAGILLGVVAASVVVAPLLAGVISAAVTTGLGLGVLGLGIAIASQFDAVQDQFTAVGRNILDDLRDSASVFIDPLIRAGEILNDSFSDMGDMIAITFANASRSVEPLTEALTGFVEQLLLGVEVVSRKMRPLIEALAVILPEFGRDLATAFAILADGSAEAVVALRDIFDVLGTLIIVTAGFIRALSDLYFWIRVVSLAMVNDFGSAAELLAERERNAKLATGQLTDGLSPLNTALGKTASEAEAARLAISGLVTEQLAGVNATIGYEQAIDDLQASIKEGNRDFRVTEENGRANLRLVEQAIGFAARQRDAELARAAETGRSVDSINAAYQREITQIENVIGANVKQDKSLKDMFATARGAPKEVAIQVKTPGLQAATTNWLRFREAVRNAISTLVAAGVANITGSGSGLKTTVQYANGGIVTSPTLGLIGEAGYKEAVIPDPAVMPKRAMELSNRFGLTQMIADSLGSAQTVVNVFIGSQRLEQIADYRIALNNTSQAQSLSYGPRPA